jgi:hypothetical protein
MSMSTPMTPIRFRLTKVLVVKAATLASSRYYLRFIVFAVIVGLLTSAFFIFRGPGRTFERDVLAVFLTVAGAVIIALLFLALMRYVIYPFYARKNFQQQKALSDEMSLSWTGEVFLYQTGASRTEMPFAHLHGYRASDDIIILYVADAIYFVVPVGAFGDGETVSLFMRRLQQANVRKL